ncbi:MAG: segregation/condensation protein A [Patescibacteria group bacterium]|nr:segregation/condensation protein A [Patescibacteria group bacterium]MDD4304366.1 segregation/condensation protein A [Patescibacteria group bacterium]MDD4695389.1 segregation/condensation protein A [Patescibacteria group bacterium]
MLEYKLEKFEGPLELLLKLIDENELDISQVSLSQVTDQYINYIDNSENLGIDEIADFLVIAAKLIYIKSRLILPEIINSTDEDDSKDLEKILKIYKQYYDAKQILQKIIRKKYFTYSRETKLVKIKQGFIAPNNINKEILEKKFNLLISNLKPISILPKRLIEKTINIKEKIDHIRNLINSKNNISFSEFIKDRKNKTEVIVSFLAMLELIRQRDIMVNQEYMFEEITISAVR